MPKSLAHKTGGKHQPSLLKAQSHPDVVRNKQLVTTLMSGHITMVMEWKVPDLLVQGTEA